MNHHNDGKPGAVSSFFLKLLSSFLLTSVGPVLVMALLTTAGINRFVSRAFNESVQNSVSSAAGFAQYLLSEAALIASTISEDENVIAYTTGAPDAEAENQLSTKIRQRINQTARSDYYDVFVIPLDRTYGVVYRYTLPKQYSSSAGNSWGILGTLNRTFSKSSVTDAESGSQQDSYVLFGQPHSADSRSVPLALGKPIYSGFTLTGYVVVDIQRKAFAEIIGLNVSRQGALADLFLLDSADCVVYSVIGEDREGLFLEEVTKETGLTNSSVIFERRQIENGLSVFGVYPESAVESLASSIRGNSRLMAVITVVVALIATILISRSISNPVASLTGAMRQVEQGNLDVRCPLPVHTFSRRASNDEMSFLVERFNSMVGRTKNLLDETIYKQELLRTAEIQALQSQINPHFLYNTLSSIRSMANLQGARDAAEMVSALARILREGLKRGTDSQTLENALKLAKDYFLIESHRWPGRFTLVEEVPEELLKTRIPSLVIQPVVENALVHGLEKKEGDGTLTISARIEAENHVIISVKDDGNGMDEKTLALLRGKMYAPADTAELPGVKIDVSAAKEGELLDDGLRLSSSGIALVNTHRRLRLLFGRKSGLYVESFEGSGTCVEIHYYLDTASRTDKDFV